MIVGMMHTVAPVARPESLLCVPWDSGQDGGVGWLAVTWARVPFACTVLLLTPVSDPQYHFPMHFCNTLTNT